MTYLSQMKALAEQFKTDIDALLAEAGESSKAERAAAKAERHARHPGEPEGASLVKVFFTGDRIDGNTFAVGQPTEEFKRIKADGGGRVSKRMWKYTYERETGTSRRRSFAGMLKTLDGHGRTVTKIEIYRPNAATEVVDFS